MATLIYIPSNSEKLVFLFPLILTRIFVLCFLYDNHFSLGRNRISVQF